VVLKRGDLFQKNLDKITQRKYLAKNTSLFQK